MPGTNFVLDKGFLAQAATTQFHVVKGGTANEACTPVTATNDQPLGVAQEAATAAEVTNGKVINVRMMGISRCICQGTIARWTRVRAHSTGRVVALSGAAGTVDNLVGITMFSAVDGDHVDVFLTIGATVNTAAS
jgi:hypothetical protein